ncbi:MAG TPA: HAD family phosphatase [Actinomycetes bacterium]|jgi:HAD superfamily hydrolase (TIGR01509 family)|nr:HAD family phosphatase [Actinomycetes bacterium]
MLERTAAVIFDLDGVLIDSEPVWEEVRREYVARHHGRWQADSQTRLMGMSTPEWAAYLSGELGVQRPAETVATEVTELVGERYRERPPLLPGAVEAVRRLAARWPLGLASSSPPRLIDLALDLARLDELFQVRVSTEQVGHGKPAPDVYLEAAARLGEAPAACVAVEDSSNGVRSAAAAGMRVIAVPAERYPLADDAKAAASLVLANLDELSVAAVEGRS